MKRASFALKLMIKLSRIHRFCDCCHQETALIIYASHEAFGNANGCQRSESRALVLITVIVFAMRNCRCTASVMHVAI